MKASDKTLFTYLKDLRGQLTIPIYQRDYSWGEKQYQRFWEDLNQLNLEVERSEHFLGTIVSKSQEVGNEINLPEISLIDGQQRITCISLLFAAICAFCKNNKIRDFNWQEKIYNSVLLNRIGEGDKKYRLKLQKIDDETLKMIIDDLPELINTKSPSISTQIAKTYNFFYKNINHQNYLDIFYKSLKFKIFDGQAEEHDDAQIIFDSLNTTGSPLKSFEQIRNYTLMDYDNKTQQELYYKYWSVMMDYFKNKSNKFDDFTEIFKKYRIGKLNQGGKVYDYIKQVVRNGTDKKDILKELFIFYKKFIAIQEYETGIEEVDETLRFILKISGSELPPIILKIYDAYLNKTCSEKEFIACINHLDTFICRHKVMGNGLSFILRNSFKNLNDIDETNCFKSIKKLTENHEINDSQFLQGLKTFEPYTMKKSFCKIFLERIENNFYKKGSISLNKYSVEHIMPKTLNDDWKSQLGTNYQQIHYMYCESLGNLTLTAYNSEMSNDTFEEKLNMENGFKDDRLHLNKSVAKYNHWNEDTILKRLAYLSNVCLDIWRYPEFNIGENYKQDILR